MNGLAPGAKFHVAPTLRQSNPFWIAPNAVLLATLKLKAGDVMLVEVQNFDFTPFETSDLEFAVIKQATALGIHVVEAAGNGALNLDAPNCTLFPHLCDPATGASKFDRRVRDSGAIFVGGGDIFHQPVPGSNYGSRCDAHSWAQDVATLGYGPTILPNCASPVDPNPGASGPNQYYTSCFGGTSSASAIVAGAVALVGQHLSQTFGQALDVRRMRHLLSEGTEGSAYAIGTQPDLAHTFGFVEQGGIIEHLLRANTVNDQLWTSSYLGGAVATADLDDDNHQFGAAVVGLGDQDGDGQDDLAVGAPGWFHSSPGTAPGGVFVLRLDGSEIWRFLGPGNASGCRFGSAVANAGDLDSDGADDLLIGAPLWPQPGQNERGLVQIAFGGPWVTSWARIEGEQPEDRFGTSVGPAGDFNDDGILDIAIGSPNGSPDPGGERPARVFVYCNALDLEPGNCTGAPCRFEFASAFNWTGLGHPSRRRRRAI